MQSEFSSKLECLSGVMTREMKDKNTLHKKWPMTEALIRNCLGKEMNLGKISKMGCVVKRK